MSTCTGSQASPEQPSSSVSLLDDELMSLGEEGAGLEEEEDGLRGRQNMVPRIHLAKHLSSAFQMTPLEDLGWALGLSPG
jgi:hypothetical protein